MSLILTALAQTWKDAHKKTWWRICTWRYPANSEVWRGCM